MPNFKFKAISNGGADVTGIMEAYDEFEAIDKIKQNCRVVLSINEVADKRFSLNMNIGTPKIKEKMLALMCSQFAIVLRAGMPIVRAVELIASQTADKTLRELLNQVAEDVATGYGLAQSFENKGGKMLPTTFIETVRSGEESGNLEISFEKLFAYFDKSSKTKAKVKSAMMYPAFLGVLAVAVIAIVLVFAMPVFIEMFQSMNIELPGITLFLIALSDFFTQFWPLVLIFIVTIFVGLKFWSRTEKGRMFFAKLSLKLPILGRMALMKGASQLANTMSTMLSSGLPIVRTTVICSKVLDNYFLSTQLGTAVAGLEEGRQLGTCLERCDCFPALLVEMTAVGEETGSLESTLQTIGEYYDSETAIASERALGALQPLITVVMGLIIGFVVLALYMPMFTMYGAM